MYVQGLTLGSMLLLLPFSRTIKLFFRLSKIGSPLVKGRLIGFVNLLRRFYRLFYFYSKNSKVRN